MNYQVGDRIYIYSVSLDEIIEGIIEGYADDDHHRYKILQELDDTNVLRHIVSYVYIFDTYEEAVQCQEEYNGLIERIEPISAGDIVYLLNRYKRIVQDMRGNPLEYQVVSVYRDRKKVGLVTSYGEYIGLNDISEVRYVREGPLFSKENYSVGNIVMWLDNEDVYEGTISQLNDNSARLVDIKKLFPVNHKMDIPYWKIYDGQESNKEDTRILSTIIGDDLD